MTGAAIANTTTNASGVFTFTGLANGNYTVTPSLAGFTFAPVNRAVVINNANVTGQDFVGTPAASTFSISGTVRTAGGGIGVGGGLGTPVAGVTITLGGAATGTTTTNALGVYTLTGLANGNYTVTPSLAGFTFTPVNRAVIINNANMTGQNFTRN
ncbi:MAG: hypothetical protein HZB62_13620 [Nitrospirae bacterium]|nr:hypothetical protein [Nitrospirota bacterium]